MNIFIIGANGQIGQLLVTELARNSINKVSVLVRKESQKAHLLDLGADEVVIGDLLDEVSLAENIPATSDAVVFVAGSQGKDVVGVDQEAAKRVADIVKAKLIPHFILLSSYGAAAHSDFDGSLRNYLIAKGKADDYVQQLGIPFTILRPGTLNNEPATGLIATAESGLETKGKTIARADVALVIAEVLQRKELIGKSFELIEGDEPISTCLAKL